MTKGTQMREPDLLGAEIASGAAMPVQAPPATAGAKSKAVAKNARRVPLSDEGADEVAILLHAVADPNCDVGKAERLRTMINEERARRAQIAYDEAFAALQDELPEIDKDGKIVIEGKAGKRGQSTAYATYPNIQRATRKMLHKHGFTLRHTVRPGREGVGIAVHSFLSHGGYTEQAELPLPLETSGSKNNVQGVHSSISYGKRINSILLMDLISKDPKDDDLDGFKPKRGVERRETGEVVIDPQARISAEQAETLKEKVESCGVGEKRFLEKYQIQAIEDLAASLYDEAESACLRFAAEKAAAAKRK
jgi:hypothetical protein